MKSASFLDDVLVVSVEQSISGPLCTRNLAELGARVIKVERPGGGDVARAADRVVGNWSSLDLWVNTSKESLGLNLKHPRCTEVLQRLASRADVLIENNRPGLARELGLEYEDLRVKNPKLIFCQISGFGQDGPYASKKAFDFIIQGETGLIELTGTPDTPVRVGAAISDTITGLYATIAIVSALLRARQTGVGHHIDVSMLEATAWLLSNTPFLYWHRGDLPQRMGARHPLYCPYGVYEASDGRLNIAVLTDAMWLSFSRLIGRPDIAADPRFATIKDRGMSKTELNAIIEPVLASRTCAEWMAMLEGAGIPCGMVRGVAAVLEHPQLSHRGFFSLLPTEAGDIKLFNFPAKFDGRYCPPQSLPPDVGAQTGQILAEIGYSKEEIDEMLSGGVI